MNYAGLMTELLTATESLSPSSAVRRGLAGVTIAVSALLLVPAFTGSDDFPISSQPMFAAPRENIAEFVTARGIDVDGAPVDLSIEEIARTDDPLVAEVLLLNAASGNTLPGTCREISERTDRSLAAIEIVRVRIDLDDGLGSSEVEVEVLERCQAS